MGSNDLEWVTSIITDIGETAPKYGVWLKQAEVDQCRIVTMQITFNTDGSGHLIATLKSSLANKNSYVRESFKVMKSDGSTLFTLGPWESPKMNKVGELVLWQKQFNYDSTKYTDMSKCDRRPVNCLHD